MDNVIKSFLVGLGFGVDDASLAKFNKAITNATVKVTALYGSINLLAGAIVKNISDISEGFEQMGYEYRIIAPAINKALALRRELLKAYSAAGINIQKTIQASVKLNFSLAKTKFAMEAIYKSVGSRFFGLLTKQSDLFRKKIYENMPKIQNAIERFVKFIFKALEAVTTLGIRLWSILTRVYDFFVALDKATDGWSTIILGVIAAWRLLNLSFLASPLGIILALGAALLALYDDYETWKEGGESFFDWSKAEPFIVGVTHGLKDIELIVKNLIVLFSELFNSDKTKFLDSLKNIALAFLDISNAVDKIIKAFDSEQLNSLLKWRNNIEDSIAGFFGNGTTNALGDLRNGPLSSQPQALGSNGNSSLVNQHVNQQTQINVNSSADANSVGKAVSGEQNKVNFDLTRNFKSAAPL